MDIWQLPVQATFGGVTYRLHTDYRDILEIFSYLEDPDLPDQMKWLTAIALFYEEQVRPEHLQEAAQFLARFLCCGREERGVNQQKLLDWQQDGSLIVADVNKVAGREIRALPYLHWWTFLSYFNAIGEGQLSNVVSIRKKLRTGEKLDDWEKHFYRENKQLVELKKRYSRQELEEQARLNRLLRQQEKKGR